MITGLLKDTSPLRRAFSNGAVPLISPIPAKAILGDDKHTTEVYMIAVAQITKEQKEAMAKTLEDLGQGPFAECLAAIEKDVGFPARAIHFSSVGTSLRGFV